MLSHTLQFLQLHLDPASSNSLPANGNIKQTMRVTNSQKGKVHFLLFLSSLHQIYITTSTKPQSFVKPIPQSAQNNRCSSLFSETHCDADEGRLQD